MHPTIQTLHGLEQLTLRAARHTQAWAIVAVDRLARRGEEDRATPLGRLWQFQLNLASLAVGDPARFADSAYQQVERLLSLNREYVQRLMEAIDATRPRRVGSASNVVRLTPRRSAR